MKDDKSFGFLTIDKLGNVKKRPYTYKEIVEIDYADVWKVSVEYLNMLNGWQDLLVKKALPPMKDIVSSATENRGSKNAQQALLNYLKLRSIYGFAHYIWGNVNYWCHELGVSANEHNQGDINRAQAELIRLFETLGKVLDDISDSVGDNTTGFQKLEKVISCFGSTTDFQVLRQWSFRNIVNSIKNDIPENLWESALNDDIPTEPNVGGLMESEEDNKCIRMY